MPCKIEYTIHNRKSSIVEALGDFKLIDQVTPYQNVYYLKMSLRKYYFYSIVRRTRPFFVKFYINNTPRLIIPLSKSFFSSKYYFYGDKSGFGYLDLIYADSVSVSEINSCIKILINDLSPLVFIFNRMRKDSLFHEAIRSFSCVKSSEIAVKIDLKGSYDDYFNLLSKNARQNFRTANNRLLKDSRVVNIFSIPGKEISNDTLSKIKNLYLDRIKSYKKNITFIDRLFYNSYDLGFYGLSHLDFSEVFLLEIDGELAAFMICLSDKNQIIVPRLAIDNSFSFYSPGVILAMSAIKEIINRKSDVKIIDFMQGQEKYKYQIGGYEHEVLSLEIS